MKHARYGNLSKEERLARSLLATNERYFSLHPMVAQLEEAIEDCERLKTGSSVLEAFHGAIADFDVSVASGASSEREAAQLWEEWKFLRNVACALIISRATDKYLAASRPLVAEPIAVGVDDRVHYGPGDSIDEAFFDTFSGLLAGLNITLKEEIAAIVRWGQSLVTGHPFGELIRILDLMVEFSDVWGLVTRERKVGNVSAFIERGIDSLTSVPVQVVRTIARMSGIDATVESVCQLYSNSYGVIALFASGDREIFGQVRRALVDQTADSFTDDLFVVSPRGKVKVNDEVLKHAIDGIRRRNADMLGRNEIWMRGSPRVVTFCPAIAPRHKSSALRQLFNETDRLLRTLVGWDSNE